MINVIYDHQIFSLQRFGGATRYFLNLGDALLKKGDIGVEFQLGIFNKANLLEAIRPYLRGIQGGLFLPPHGVPRFFINELFSYYYKVQSSTRDQNSVHHCTYIYPPHVKSNAPLIVTHHDCTLEKFPDQFRHSDRTVRIKRSIYQRANKIITISNRSKIDLMEFYGVPEEKIRVVYHGVEPPLAEEGCISPFLTAPRPYLLYVGARTPYKNFDGLLRAYAMGKIKGDFNVVAAGGTPFTKPEKELMEKLGINDNVIGFPGISQEGLGWLYYHAHGLVYPSTYEGFGFPPLEAMSMGCPTLASNSSCLPEVLGDGPLYFESGVDSDLASQLELLCYDHTLRISLIARGKETVKKYTWGSTADNTIAVYKALLG